MLMEALLLHGDKMGISKIVAIIFIFVALVAMVTAISFFGDTNFKGFSVLNVSMLSFSDGTNMTTAATGTGSGGWFGNATTDLNMTGHNVTSVDCVVFSSGGSICTG